MALDAHIEDLAYEIAFWSQGIEDPAYPLGQVGSLCLEISDKFRSLAIMVLLAKADVDLFFHNLIRSGASREKYLKRLKSEGIDKDHDQAAGRYEALLDSIAAGEFDLARRITGLSPKEYMEGHEYEDDYCYAQTLHRLIQENPPEHEILPFLDRFETYLEGQPDARLDVCRALLEKDQEAFDEAFEVLLVEREAKIAADKERGQLEDPVVIAQRLVFIEGLAILRLAERRGLKTQTEYRYCPSLARIPMRTPFPGD